VSLHHFPGTLDFLTVENRNSSPLTATMQTPSSASGPFHTLSSVSSRERFGSHSALGRLDCAACSTPSPASESPELVPRPLRRSASEVSQRQPSLGTRYTSRRLQQDLRSTTLPLPSHPSSSTISSALDGSAHGSALHVSGASAERQDISPSASACNLGWSDARWSPGNAIMSSDQLLAFREFLARRAQDAVIETRSCVTSPDRDQDHHGFGDFCEDAASDCSEYGESIQSGRRYSLDEPDILDSVDGKSTGEDLWSALSITPAVRTWDSSDNYSLLANGDTFLDLNARSSSPASQLQSESSHCRNPHISPLQPRTDPQPQPTADPRSSMITTSITPEEMQDFLPNFLDLRAGVDLPGSVADEALSGSGDLHLSKHDKRAALVSDCSAADPSLQYNPRRLEGERPKPSVTSHGPRRVQSANELDSRDSRHGHRGTGVQAHSQGKPESDNPPRGNSYYAKRVQERRARDGQHPNPGLSLSQEVGPVSQRRRSKTVLEVTARSSPAPDRLRRSASTTMSALSTSTKGRYRTLEDRAYRHPDVPHSPLFSDLDHGISSQGSCPISPSPKEPFNRHDLRVTSPETGHAPLIHAHTLSLGEVYSRNASSRSPVPPHMPPGHIRNDSYPVRKRPAQTHLRRPGSSLDSRPGSSFTPIPPSSTKGVGLSLIDNGAFETPRPAPEPRTQMHENVNAPSRPVPREAPAAAAKKAPADDEATRDSIFVVAASLTGFGALPRRVWSRRQKQAPQSDGLLHRLGSAINSESDLKSSFISMVEDEHVKPQRKGLLSFKRK
jgi:hypothetical protein